jgi:hypothetical protein
MVAHDNDTTDIIVSYIINQTPSPTSGKLYYNNSGTFIECTIGTEIITANGTNLKFQPVAGFTGNAKFTYTAKDDED